MSTVFADKFKNTSGGNNVKVNQLSGIDTAGSILVTGEGNSTTTNLQQGLCKSWCHLTGTGTPQYEDSFNTTTLTDTGTGRRTLNFANPFASGNYTCAGMVGNDATTVTGRMVMYDNLPTTSAFAYRNTLDNAGGARDDTNEAFSLHGDLA